MTFYRGLGGAAGGGSVLATAALEASLIPASSTTNVYFTFPGIAMTAGVYSVEISSVTGTTGAKQYSYKSGQATLTTNGVVLDNVFWIQENNNSAGQSTTNFAASYVLADYRLSWNNYSFGNYRIGSTLSTQIGLTNSAIYTTNNATEKLYSTGVVSGSVTLSGLSTNLLAVNQFTLFNLSLNSNNVGNNTGFVTLAFRSYTNGTASARVGGPTNIGSQQITVSGVGYRLAAAGLNRTNVNVGSYHLGDTLSGMVVVTNMAANDSFSEKLSVSTNSISGNLTVSGGPTGLLAALSSANITVGMNSSSVGTNIGTFTLGFASDGAGTSGLSSSNLGSQIITVRGLGYQLASAALAVTNINLGRIHEGGSFGGQYLSLSNSASVGFFTETLGASFGTATGGATGNGSVTNISAGATDTTSLLVSLSDNSAGNKSGTIQVNLASREVNGSGLGTTLLADRTVVASGLAYTGRAHWNTNGGGSWSSFENWDVAGGTPGLDGALSTNDIAMFAAGPVSGITTVNLNGANPALSALIFSNGLSSYAVAAGSGGNLTLGTVGHAGVIGVSGGSHTISASVALAQDATINVTETNAGLTVSGSISGVNKNLIKTGLGWAILSSTNTYTGSTIVSEGRLSVNGSVASADITVLSGATLGGTGIIRGLTTIESGGTLSPGNSPGILTFTNGVVFDGGSHLLWQLLDNTSDPLQRGIAYDGIDLLGGNVQINSNAVLDLDFASMGSTVNWTDSFWNTNQYWALIKNVDLSEILGAFTSINVGMDSSSRSLTSVHPGSFFTVFTDGNNNLGLNYNTVSLPEPSAYTLIATGASVLSFLRRRRLGARSMRDT